MKKIVLIAILLLAAALRLWRLGDYPALNADEAAIGYNVYSLIQTGADEHGNTWPIHFQSFNDYKPGLTFYLVFPVVKLFGLNVWSVRILPALLGVATVYVICLLVNEIFEGSKWLVVNVKSLKKKQDLSLITYPLSLGEIAAFLLAISPWHIHFSRGAWEVNVATFLITLGVLFFLKGLKNKVFLFFGSLVFTLSFYTYHSARVVIPLLLVGLAIIYKDTIKSRVKDFLLPLLIGITLLLPLGLDLSKGEVLSRAAGVGLFADKGVVERINEQRFEHLNKGGEVPVFLHNKAVNYTLAFFSNWFEHFHGEFLFLSGDEIQRNKVPETGQMYMIDAILLVIGGWWMVRNLSGSRYFGGSETTDRISSHTNPIASRQTLSIASLQDDKGILLILWWLLVAPVAAALTFQSPHALRAQNMVIPLVIISALGLRKVLSWIILLTRGVASNQPPGLFYAYTPGLLVLIILWGLLRYQLMYWKHMSKEYPFSSQYGVHELVDYLSVNRGHYDSIIVTDRYDQPYILFLFYQKYPPEIFQKEHKISIPDIYGFSTVREFGSYTFRSIDWEKDKNLKRVLLAGTDEEIPDDANIIKEIYGTNGYKYFQVVAN